MDAGGCTAEVQKVVRDDGGGPLVQASSSRCRCGMLTDYPVFADDRVIRLNIVYNLGLMWIIVGTRPGRVASSTVSGML